MGTIESLVDDIYEASVIPERWVRVLDGMAEISDAEGTILFADTPHNNRWIASPRIDAAITSFMNDGWMQRNTRGNRLIPIREPRFLTDLDAFTREEVEREPQYEYYRAHGLGWCVGTAIHSAVGDTLVFSIERAYRKGPVEQPIVRTLDGIRPHLARAALLSARIGLERARATVDALETLGLPAAVLTQAGHAVAANPRFQTCAPAIVIGARDLVHFASPVVQALFVGALEASRAAPTAEVGRTIPIAADRGHDPLIAHILPLRGAGRDLFSGAAVVLLVTPVSRQKGPDDALLQALFDLTPAEARVARLLAEGKGVDAIARAQGVTPNTVRMQLKSVFAKSGVTRQAELVSLLSWPRYGDARP